MGLQPVTIKLPPDCEKWNLWVPELREFDGKTLTTNSALQFKNDKGVDYYIPFAWCHPPAPPCKWLPWDEKAMDKSKGYYVTPGNMTVHFDGREWRYDADMPIPKALPTHYLANIPEPPQ